LYYTAASSRPVDRRIERERARERESERARESEMRGALQVTACRFLLLAAVLGL
jgi:hypothetical protein